MDTYGGFHSGALKMLKTCAGLRAESSGGDCGEIYRNLIVKMQFVVLKIVANSVIYSQPVSEYDSAFDSCGD